MTSLDKVIALTSVREYDRRTRSGGTAHVRGYDTFTQKIAHGLAVLHSMGKASPYDNDAQKAAYSTLTPHGQDMYQGLRSIGASHRVAMSRAIHKHGRKLTLAERLAK